MRFEMDPLLLVHTLKYHGNKGTTPDTFCDENPPGKFYCHRYRH